MLSKVFVVELAADEEEEQDEADGAEGVECAERALREQAGGGVRGDAAEDGWTEENAADDFSDDAALAELARYPTAEKCDEQDRGHLQEQLTHAVSRPPGAVSLFHDAGAARASKSRSVRGELMGEV